MQRNLVWVALFALLLVYPAHAQTTDETPGEPATQTDAPAPGEDLPEVEVIQEEPQPAQQPQQQAEPSPPPAQPPAAQPQAAATPAAEPEVFDDTPDVAPSSPAARNSPYGAAGSGGAARRAETGATPPLNPKQLIPGSLENFSSAGTRLDPETLQERQPRDVNEALARVPGVLIVNDDGAAHHGGIGIRGAPPRRARKILVMEDGQPVNLALWLDPSVHYFAPIERVESFEVLRGTVIVHGPNNNFGVINARLLSPFGPNETVVSSAIGVTESDTGFFINEDDEVVRGSNDTDLSTRWHAHTRQTFDNVGVVFSYTGENVQGSWDTERLRVHDFYGAIGWKGVDQDLTLSLIHARQRDNYDESNLEGEDDDDPGEVEDAFFNVKHCKTCFAPGAVNNTYNADVWRSQLTHNMYFDRDTTMTSRVYYGYHRRDRYQIVSLESNPDGSPGGDPPAFVGPDADGLFDVETGEDSMFGRLRTFRHVGSEVRGEWANRPVLAGMTQDIQAGIRYEYQDMTNRNFLGLDNEILEDHDDRGLTIFERNLDANTVSAFLQTTIRPTNTFNISPGVRFEYYNVDRQSLVTAVEEGEAEEEDDCEEVGDDEDGIDNDNGECLVIEGINRTPFDEGFDSFNVLPGISFSYTGFFRTTLFGGYHRGLTATVKRNEDFPVDDELGDNFQAGLRSTAIKGLNFEVAVFHQRIRDFQFGSSFSSAADRAFGRADRVEINGVETFGRLESQPYTGGPWNLFAEGQYTYMESKFEKGIVDGVSIAGNDVPEVPFHIAALTLGVENTLPIGWRWDASITWSYRGEFFTDEFNTAFGGDPEGENGLVPDVWLLSARANLALGDTGASIFVAGTNLTNKIYITDREDGLKPGLGRTVWTGFTYKF